MCSDLVNVRIDSFLRRKAHKVLARNPEANVAQETVISMRHSTLENGI